MQTEPSVALEWIVGGFAAMLLFGILGRILNASPPTSEKRIITSVAVANGLILEIGLSPMAAVASELVLISHLLTTDFSHLVRSLIAVGTFFDIVIGLGRMAEGTGWFGIIAFVFAFVGGSFLPYVTTAPIGGMLILTGYLLSEAAPTNHWMSTRL